FVAYSGDLFSGGGMSSPMLSSRSFVVAVSSAWLSAALSFCTIGAGVPLGSSTMFHVVASKLSRPCSCEVRNSGRSGVRLGARLARALIWLPLMLGNALVMMLQV